jgi:hypothetical protein
MALQITGKLKKLLPSQSGQGKNGDWTKQPFIIETDGQYPKEICFEAWKDLAKQIPAVVLGTTITVHFDIESQEWNGKYYTTAKAWKYEIVADAEPINQSEEPEQFGDLPF